MRFLILSRGVKRRISRCAERSISHAARGIYRAGRARHIARAKHAYHAPEAQFTPRSGNSCAQRNLCNAVAIHATKLQFMRAAQIMQAQPAIHLVLAYPIFLGLIQFFRPHIKRRAEKSTFPSWGRQGRVFAPDEKVDTNCAPIVCGPNPCAARKGFGPYGWLSIIQVQKTL